MEITVKSMNGRLLRSCKIGYLSGVNSKIHDDSDILPVDKFQYLLKSVVPGGTRANDLIENFPSTAVNYSKTIEGLRARFVKDDLIVEVYVRELLKLVLLNDLNCKTQTLLKLCTINLSQISALETLGVKQKSVRPYTVR